MVGINFVLKIIAAAIVRSFCSAVDPLHTIFKTERLIMMDKIIDV